MSVRPPRRAMPQGFSASPSVRGPMVRPSTCGAAVLAMALALGFALGSTGIEAQAGPRDGQSIVLLHSMAERGLECGLLNPWQVDAMRGQTAEIVARWTAAERVAVAADLARAKAETACDAASLTGWIEATERGLEVEGLAHFLVIYRALATMDSPPALLLHMSPRLDYSGVVAKIDAQIAAWEASGAKPEGGVLWAEFVTRTGQVVVSFAEALKGGTAPGGNMTIDQAAAMMAQSIKTTELWLAEEASGGR